MAKGTGTFHHRLRGWTGILMILALPFFLYGFAAALSGRAEGFTQWLSEPLGAISALVFLSATIWYCKLEFDEVIMDYLDGGTRSFALCANRLIGFAGWAVSVYVILKMWLGA